MPASKFQSAAAGKASAPKAQPGGKAAHRAGVARTLPGTEAKTTVDRETGQVVPLVLLYNGIRFWWLLFLIAVVGGLLGWAISSTRPPVYEAVARFRGSIDYTGTGPLTQYEEDTAYNTLRNVLTSDVVMQAVVDEAVAQGTTLQVADLMSMTYPERKFDTWELRIRDGDPQKARQIAEIWARQGALALQESYRHAVLADEISRSIRVLEGCLGRAVQGQTSDPVCTQQRFVDLQEDLLEAGNRLAQERNASQGMFVGLIPAPSEPISAPDRPVQNDRNQFVLAGCLLGFLIGLGIVETGLPTRWRR